MKTFEGMRYSKDHEWVRIEEGTAYVGITNFAQLALGDIVFVDLPKSGISLKAGDTIGAVESVKTASDIYTPVSGVITAVNAELTDQPEKINQEPYESWIIQLKPSDLSELEGLMDEEAYGEYCAKEA